MLMYLKQIASSQMKMLITSPLCSIDCRAQTSEPKLTSTLPHLNIGYILKAINDLLLQQFDHLIKFQCRSISMQCAVLLSPSVLVRKATVCNRCPFFFSNLANLLNIDQFSMRMERKLHPLHSPGWILPTSMPCTKVTQLEIESFKIGQCENWTETKTLRDNVYDIFQKRILFHASCLVLQKAASCRW